MARRAGANGGQGSPDMELEITDFGPIARGRIALRPLTVLVGPNNSGKSYASVLAHSVISSCADLAASALSGAWAEPLLESEEFQGLSDRAARLAASGNGRGEAVVPRGLAEAVHDCTVGRLFEAALLSHIRRNFASPLGDLVRSGSRSSRVRIGGPVSADASISRGGGARVRVDPGPVSRATARRGQGRGVARGRPGARPSWAGVAGDRGHAALLGLASAIAGRAIANVPPGPSHYLPAARSGIVCAYGALAPGVLRGYAHGAQAGAVAAGPVSDLVASLARGAGRASGGRNGAANGRGGAIAGIFGGSVGWRGAGAGGIYSHMGTRVPIHRSSSGVAETAPLALAAAAMGKGDTLIVEEPEAHLHPKSQVALAGRLVALVRQGMRVVLSTHSDFLLGQLDIFVKLGSLTPSRRAARGYPRDAYVGDDEVAPYAFAGSARKGYAISELEHSATDGIAYEGFMSVVESMAEEDYRIHLARGR